LAWTKGTYIVFGLLFFNWSLYIKPNDPKVQSTFIVQLENGNKYKFQFVANKVTASFIEVAVNGETEYAVEGMPAVAKLKLAGWIEFTVVDPV